MLYLDEGGPVVEPGGEPFTGKAAYTFLHGEPTLYTFSREDVEQAVRNTYQATDTGTVFAVTFVRPELLKPFVFDDVASSWAAVWNANRQVPGVTDIAPDQRVLPLGGLEDVVDVAVESSSGRSSDTVTLSQAEVWPDVFAARIGEQVARLDAIEGRAP